MRATCLYAVTPPTTTGPLQISWLRPWINPLTTNSFPNSTHFHAFSMSHLYSRSSLTVVAPLPRHSLLSHSICSSPTAFTPVPQPSLLSHSIRSSPIAFAPQGPDLVGQAHIESPSGNTINDIHDHPEDKQLGVKGGGKPNFQAGPSQTWTRFEWWDTPSMSMVIWGVECQMPIWDPQRGLWNSLNPNHWRGCAPFTRGTFCSDCMGHFLFQWEVLQVSMVYLNDAYTHRSGLNSCHMQDNKLRYQYSWNLAKWL